MSDHYQTLGVDKTATPEEIKRAYRKLASQHHPDKGGDTAEFQKVEEAYRTLGDPQKRAEYDNPPQSFNFQNFGGAPHNIHDIFSQMFGGGMGGFPGQHPRRNHVRMTIWVTLEDVARGGSRTVQVGSTQGQTTVEIEIPVGIEDGDNVQYGGVAPGGVDLVVQFRVNPNPDWRRNGLDLHREHRVSIWDLIVGGDTEIRTILNSTLSMRIPARTQPNTVMRIRQQGLRSRSGQQGDLYVKLVATIPNNIAPEIVEAIQKHKS